MIIEIINKKGATITNFNLESNPFKVGETVSVNVKNHDLEIWLIENVKKILKIEKISHHLRKEYSKGGRIEVIFTVIVETSEINEIPENIQKEFNELFNDFKYGHKTAKDFDKDKKRLQEIIEAYSEIRLKE